MAMKTLYAKGKSVFLTSKEITTLTDQYEASAEQKKVDNLFFPGLSIEAIVEVSNTEIALIPVVITHVEETGDHSIFKVKFAHAIFGDDSESDIFIESGEVEVYGAFITVEESDSVSSSQVAMVEVEKYGRISQIIEKKNRNNALFVITEVLAENVEPIDKHRESKKKSNANLSLVVNNEH